MRSVCRALHYHHYRHHHHHLNYQEAAQWVQHIQLYIFLIVTIIIQITKKRHNEISMTSLTGSVESCVAVEVNLRVLFVCSLGAVHKWRHHFWGYRDPPPSPLSSCHLSAPPPSLCKRKWWEELIRDKTAYPGSLMNIFSAQLLFLCLGLIWPLKCV